MNGNETVVRYISIEGLTIYPRIMATQLDYSYRAPNTVWRHEILVLPNLTGSSVPDLSPVMLDVPISSKVGASDIMVQLLKQQEGLFPPSYVYFNNYIISEQIEAGFLYTDLPHSIAALLTVPADLVRAESVKALVYDTETIDAVTRNGHGRSGRIYHEPNYAYYRLNPKSDLYKRYMAQEVSAYEVAVQLSEDVGFCVFAAGPDTPFPPETANIVQLFEYEVAPFPSEHLMTAVFAENIHQRVLVTPRSGDLPAAQVRTYGQGSAKPGSAIVKTNDYKHLEDPNHEVVFMNCAGIPAHIVQSDWLIAQRRFTDARYSSGYLDKSYADHAEIEESTETED